MSELWQQEAARIGGPMFAEVLIEMRDTQRQMVIDMASLKARDQADESAAARLLSAFPAADVDGHRRYHQAVIEWRELRNKMVKEALIKAAAATTLGALGWIAVAIWQSFKLTVKQ